MLYLALDGARDPRLVGAEDPFAHLLVLEAEAPGHASDAMRRMDDDLAGRLRCGRRRPGRGTLSRRGSLEEDDLRERLGWRHARAEHGHFVDQRARDQLALGVRAAFVRAVAE